MQLLKTVTDFICLILDCYRIENLYIVQFDPFDLLENNMYFVYTVVTYLKFLICNWVSLQPPFLQQQVQSHHKYFRCPIHSCLHEWKESQGYFLTSSFHCHSDCWLRMCLGLVQYYLKWVKRTRQFSFFHFLSIKRFEYFWKQLIIILPKRLFIVVWNLFCKTYI